MKEVPLRLVVAVVLISSSPLRAQVGNNNPGGVSGIFNGQINTGCSYDPFTGNATRSITDIGISGTVGEYPLALVRIANSRTPSTTGVFGWHGGWNHNYNWIMEDSPATNTQNFHPVKYTVDFPDGRVETFRPVTWDSNYRVRPGADTPAQSTSSGVRERLAPMYTDPNNNLRCYLLLPDGGKVRFQAQQYTDGSRYWYKYHVTAIIDPYGLTTTIDSEVVGQAQTRRITTVTEPAGRSLQFSYLNSTSPRITRAQEYVNGVARRSVQYFYTNSWLSSVVYYGDNQWTAQYKYTASNTDPSLPFLLWTCDDPMYPGPMKRIAYEYKTGTNPDGNVAVYGQIRRERYWDGVAGHEGSGHTVSELTVGTANPVNHNVRIETRAGDVNQTRRFIYTSAGYLTWAYDFMNHAASQTYDGNHWINSVTDRNNNTTEYTCDPITGNVTQISFPLTPGDTPSQGNTHPTVNYTYTNNYYLHTAEDEGGKTTTITRDGTNRITRIDYPDGGYETFPSYNSFNQVLTHRMITSGTETFTYDGRGLRQTYRNPDNASGNPTLQYQYDAYDHVSDVTDVLGTLADLNHTTSFSYNLRGQLTVTTLSKDPVDNSRHTISNIYNPDGTLQSRTDELGHLTSYLFDDYRRLRIVTSPVRGGGDNNVNATSLFYDTSGSGDDYKYTDANVTYVQLPRHPGQKTKTVYDNNRRKVSVTLAPNTSDEATTSFTYDNVGNVILVTNPRQVNTACIYDERNRPSEMHDTYGNITRIQYDTAGRRKSIQRPNGQLITYDSFDAMNRVTQLSVSQEPTGIARSRYTYYTPNDGPNAPVGLLKSFEDPHLYNSGDNYTYDYDNMGRKRVVTYPQEPSTAIHRHEYFTYDIAGRLQLYTNRANSHQTFSYDRLHRITDFSWDDGSTPSVHFDYDAASRLTGITNRNPGTNGVIATISRGYFNDNLLQSETEAITGGVARTVSYTYDANGNRSSLQIPDYSFTYDYTWRDQLRAIKQNGAAVATYTYDENGYKGDLTSCNLNNATQTGYAYDNLDRVTWVTDTLNNAWRAFIYGYDNVSGNRIWTKRRMVPNLAEDNKGDVFSYDLADQVTAVQLDIPNPDTTPAGQRTIIYDSNGNRMWYTPPGVNKRYDPPSGAASNLNQYTSAIINGSQYNLSYRADANLAHYDKGNSTFNYDAQNRLTSATVNATTMTFTYDGLNRQISRRTGTGTTYYSTWDGWNSVEDYHKSGNNAVADATYLYGLTGLLKNLRSGNYYYQDGSGSTALLTNSSGQLLEWYRYDLDGTPIFYNPNDTQRNPNQSGYGVRHLFTGQQWYQELALYDLRNRFYSPDLGRFLQPDPIGFSGGNNLYRYCHNNPVTGWDPSGMQAAVNTRIDGNGSPAEAVLVPIIIDAPFDDNPADHPSFNPMPGFGPIGGPGGGDTGGTPRISGITFEYHPSPRKSNKQQQTPPQNLPDPGFDIYHPKTTAEFIIAGNIIEHGDTTDTTPVIDPIDLLSGGIAALVRSSIRSLAVRGAINAGARLPAREAGNFIGQAQRTVIGEGEVLYGIRDAGSKNLWWTRVQPAGKLQWRMDQAVMPAWNEGTFIETLTVPEGQSLIGFEGPARGQGWYIGGANQLYVPGVPPGWSTLEPWP